MGDSCGGPKRFRNGDDQESANRKEKAFHRSCDVRGKHCLLFISILLVILVFSEVRENKGFRQRDRRRRRQSISRIGCYTMSLMCLRRFLGSSCASRNCPGVTPMIRLKREVKWLWSEKPVRTATSAKLSSPFVRRSCFARSTRRWITYWYGSSAGPVISSPNAPWLLKGGYAMELRLRSARTTKDIDLSLPVGSSDALKANVLSQLQSSAAIDLGDFFVFTVGQSL